jgi:transcriptional regulator
MYQQQAFRESRAEALADLILNYPFATLVYGANGDVQADAVPLIPAANGHLRGHISRGHPLVDADDSRVLVIFRGPDAYISPNWYPSKHETGREVPTWNYAMVQMHGRVRVVHEREWLLDLVRDLTDRHEAELPQPWQVDDAPPEHVQKMLNAIAGLDIEVERVEGKFKLNQNHPARNRAGVVDGLRQRDGERDQALVELMLRYTSTDEAAE